jgi:hypothetical protein
MEYWSTGVLVKHREKALTPFAWFFITPILHHSTTPHFFEVFHERTTRL